MSPNIVTIVVAAVIALVVFVLTRRFTPAPEPEVKRFGLEQAEAAAPYLDRAVEAVKQFLQSPEAQEAARRAVSQAVLGNVVALGYENGVAEDLEVVNETTLDLNEMGRESVKGHEAKIAELQQAILRLQALITNRQSELAEKKRIAALFAA